MKPARAVDIRMYILAEYIKPARRSGKKTVRIRAGDVHDEMGYCNRHPAVCSVLDTKKFLEFAEVKLIDRKGPPQGAEVYYTFALDG